MLKKNWDCVIPIFCGREIVFSVFPLYVACPMETSPSSYAKEMASRFLVI